MTRRQGGGYYFVFFSQKGLGMQDVVPYLCSFICFYIFIQDEKSTPHDNITVRDLKTECCCT